MLNRAIARSRALPREALVVLTLGALLLFVGLWTYGIWDPWELSVADLGRDLAEGREAAGDRPPLTTWLVAAGFRIFGVHEWSGRVFLALAALLAVGVVFTIGSRLVDRRVGAMGALVIVTTPTFLFNGRQMLGQAPAVLAATLVFLCAASAVFAPAAPDATDDVRRRARSFWLLGLAGAIGLSILASGLLTGPLPALLGVAAAILARGELRARDRARAGAATLILALALLAGFVAARAVWVDYEGFGWLTGGIPRGGDPPSWEAIVEALFHGFAPWSALIPFAAAVALSGATLAPRAPTEPSGEGPYRPDPAADDGDDERAAPEEGLRLALVGWAAFAFAAQSVFMARYGPATFLPLAALALLVACALRDVERSGRASMGAAVVSLLFVGLLFRDFGAYPGSPVGGLATDAIEVPEVFNPRRAWLLVLGPFGLAIALGLAADPSSEHSGLRATLKAIGDDWRSGARLRALAAPLRLGISPAWIGKVWRRGLAMKVVLILVVTLVGAGFLFGVASAVAGDALIELGLTSLAIRIGVAVAILVPVLLVVVPAPFRLSLFALSLRGGRYRFLPALVAALAVGAYASFGYLPALSAHFSPREVYDTYNALRGEGEPLGEFRVGGRAAAYYATGAIEDLDSQSDLVEFLQRDERVWAVFRADDLAAINREYRQRTGRHLFIADARSARMLLATNRPIEGRENENFLAGAVLDEAPTPEFPVGAIFDNRIELIGYDLELPSGRWVGPGQTFTIIWYFRAIARVPGAYKIFLHIDGPGQRINGDHEPVDGRYPVRLWEEGDIVVDRQSLRVPPNFGRSNLTMYIGFYAGENRLEVVSGPSDDVNRVRAGTISVR